MYKAGSDARQQRLHRGKLADWVGTGPEPQSYLAQRDNLRRALSRIEARLAASPALAEREHLVAEKSRLCAELHEIKKACGQEKFNNRNLANVFMDVAKEMLPPGTFKAIKAAAFKLHDQRQAENKNGTS